MVETPLAVEVGETVPQEVTEQEMVQVTPLLAVSFKIVALNCAVDPVCTTAVLWEAEILIGGRVMNVEPPPQPEFTAAIKPASKTPTKDVRRLDGITSLTFAMSSLRFEPDGPKDCRRADGLKVRTIGSSAPRRPI